MLKNIHPFTNAKSKFSSPELTNDHYMQRPPPGTTKDAPATGPPREPHAPPRASPEAPQGPPDTALDVGGRLKQSDSFFGDSASELADVSKVKQQTCRLCDSADMSAA